MSDYFQLFLSHISSSIFIFHFMPIMDKNTKKVSILHKLYSDTANLKLNVPLAAASPYNCLKYSLIS